MRKTKMENSKQALTKPDKYDNLNMEKQEEYDE